MSSLKIFVVCNCVATSYCFSSAAFFHGQIEERRNSRMASWFSSGDLDILVAVSSAGVYLIEPREGVFYHLYLQLKFFQRPNAFFLLTLFYFKISDSSAWFKIRRIHLGLCFPLST